MNRHLTKLIAFAAATVLAANVTTAQDKQPARPQQPAAARPAPRAADEEAIRKQARDFVQGFAKGDAKTLAASWTDQAEYVEESGAMLRGRAAIEQAFADFFKEHPGSRIDVQIESIRFPSRDTAIEEGTMLLTHAAAELPTSTRYRVLHVREDGQWKTALAREWGAEEEKLHDLAWLVGEWRAESKDREVRIGYAWNETRSCIEGRFTAQEGGRTVSSGHQHIVRDPQTGQLRSWVFDDAGGYGQTSWIRDGNRWVLEATGVSADGAETAATNVLTRLSDDEYLWRSVGRSIGTDAVPHTDAVKLTRVTAKK